MMRRYMAKAAALALPVILALILSGCGSGAAYEQITQDEAREMMESSEEYVLVDVRREDEFASGHIPGAVNLPNETIRGDAEEALPDKDQLILVYCRTGNRSKEASQKLADLGYTKVYEFGGITEWTGEIVKSE